MATLPETKHTELEARVADWLDAFKADPFSHGSDKAARLLEVVRAPDLLAENERLRGALRWLRAFWRPGSDHDTQEVQLALAAADAALSEQEGK